MANILERIRRNYIVKKQVKHKLKNALNNIGRSNMLKMLRKPTQYNKLVINTPIPNKKKRFVKIGT